MDVLKAMDSFAHRSGLFRLTMIDRPEPRALRRLPLLVLGALAIGYLLICRGTRWQEIAAGSLLFWGAYGVSGFMRYFGLRLVDDGRARLDERERLVKARTGSICGTVLAVAAIGFCLYQGCAETLGWPRPGRPLEWFYLGLGLQGAWMTLSVLVASWIEPRHVREGEG